MTRPGELRPRERRDGLLVTIFVAHAVIAMLLAPLQWFGEMFILRPSYAPETIDVLVILPLVATIIGMTHGVAAAQVWLVAMGSVLSRAHWLFRSAVGSGLLLALIACWSFVPLLRNDSFDDDFSELSPISPLSATVISLGYFLFIAALGWLVRQFGGVRLVVVSARSIPDEARWQWGIRDVLIATALSAMFLGLAQWYGESSIEITTMVFDEYRTACLLVALNAVITTPLIVLTAYRTATRPPEARRSRWRLLMFLLVCVLQVAIALVASGNRGAALFDIIDIVAIVILVIAWTGSQLIVTAVTMRALLAVGGRLVRSAEAIGASAQT